MHALLERQLRKLFGSTESVPDEIQSLLAVVSDAYEQSDADRALLERSLELTSQELLDANAGLRRDREGLERSVARRTAELERANEAARREITEHLKTETVLRAMQQRYRLLVEHSPVAILHADPDASVLHANAAAAHLVGARTDDLIGGGWIDFVHADDRERVAAEWPLRLRRAGETGEPFEIEFRRLAGESRSILCSAVALHDADENVTGYVGTMVDVTAQRAGEAEMRRSEEKYRALFEDSLDAIFISTVGGRIIDINLAGVEFFGFDAKEEMLEVEIGRDLYADPSDRERILDEMREHGSVRNRELTVKRRDGSTRIVDLTATVVPDESGELTLLRGILRDVSDQRRLEEQLLQARKLEAVGRLAGGVAHDFNNLLTAVIGNSELLEMSLAEGDAELLENVSEIKQAATRGASLTAQLLAFSKKQVVETKVLDVNRATQGMESLLRRIIGANIHLQTELAPGSLCVRADRSQIEQVILNLCVNARDAMPDAGILTIRTVALDPIDPAVGDRLSLAPGHYAVIEVVDTGEGIDPAIQDRIFEPFFTSKKLNEGTGLGLATVYGIVQQHGGQVEMTSTLGEGSTFRVYLPLVEEKPRPAHVESIQEPERGQGMVLLVEDDDSVRAFIERSLSARGYEVHCTESGSAALDFIERHDLDVLLTDVVMPKMNGVALATEARKLRPSLPVLLISGHAEIAGAARIDHDALSRFAYLQKPFSSAELARRLEDLIVRHEAMQSVSAGPSTGPAYDRRLV